MRLPKGWIVPLLLLGTLTYALAEEITLTTYYPSPRGVYSELRTQGNVQIGSIDPPPDANTAPRLHVVLRKDTDPTTTAPALLIEDQVDTTLATPRDPSPFVIDANGNVGIGKTSVGEGNKLDVDGIVNAADFHKNGVPFDAPPTPNGYINAGPYYIEANERAPDTWLAAASICRTAGARLCTDAEWNAACAAGLPGLNHMPETNGFQEWVGGMSGGGGNAWGPGCNTFGPHDSFIATKFRCCADRYNH